MLAEVMNLRMELSQSKESNVLAHSSYTKLEKNFIDLQRKFKLLQLEKEEVDQKLTTPEAELKKQLEEMQDQLTKRAEKFAGNDAAIQKLTGLPTYHLLHAVFLKFLKGENSSFLATINLRSRADGTHPDRSRPGFSQPDLEYFNQYFLTLCRLRTGILRRWPYEGPQSLPTSAKIRTLFPEIDLIVDCFEIKFETPKNPDAARKCYSFYKKAYTVKILMGVESDGNVCFLSHIYQGGISDLAIVKACGLFDHLKGGNIVLADRGFQLVEYAKDRGVTWIVPPSVSGTRGLSNDEMKDTYRIARARILVERSIGRLKKWRQLDGPLLIVDLARLDIEIRLLARLCKFLPPLIKDLRVEEGQIKAVPASASHSTGSLADAELLLNFATEAMTLQDLFNVENDLFF